MSQDVIYVSFFDSQYPENLEQINEITDYIWLDYVIQSTSDDFVVKISLSLSQ